MVVEGVATTPVDQSYVGIGPSFTIEIVLFTGMQQHVGNPRNRDNLLNRVFTLWKG